LFSSSHFRHCFSNSHSMSLNFELETLWKRAVVDCCQALIRICLEGLGKTTKSPRQDSRCSN